MLALTKADTTILDTSLEFPFDTREDNTSEAKSPEYLKWYSLIRDRKPFYYELTVGDKKATKVSDYLTKSTIFSYASTHYENLIKLITAAVESSAREELPTKKEDTISFVEDSIEIEVKSPMPKRISLGQARILSLSALFIAEENRRRFAEEEARRIAVWEE